MNDMKEYKKANLDFLVSYFFDFHVSNLCFLSNIKVSLSLKISKFKIPNHTEVFLKENSTRIQSEFGIQISVYELFKASIIF